MIGPIKMSNTRKLGFNTTLSEYVDRQKLPYSDSAKLAKNFDVSVRTVRRRFIDCKKAYSIQ